MFSPRLFLVILRKHIVATHWKWLIKISLVRDHHIFFYFEAKKKKKKEKHSQLTFNTRHN